MVSRNANSNRNWEFPDKIYAGKQHKKKFGSDAKILLALIKKQPQSRQEIMDNGNLKTSAYQRAMPLLIREKIVKKKGNQYTLYNYVDWKGRLEQVVREYSIKFPRGQLSLTDLANVVGMPPKNIKIEAFQLTHKYGIKIGNESRPRLNAISLGDVIK